MVIKWIKTEVIPNNPSKMCKNTWDVDGHLVETWQNKYHGPWHWTCTCTSPECNHGTTVTTMQEGWLRVMLDGEFDRRTAMLRITFSH